VWPRVRPIARADGSRFGKNPGPGLSAISPACPVSARLETQITSAAPPPPRKTPERAAPRLEPFKQAIDAMLRTDLTAPRKRRHTVRRIRKRLIAENNAGQLSYSTVRDYVARPPRQL
jgi:hypothetical protein